MTTWIIEYYDIETDSNEVRQYQEKHWGHLAPSCYPVMGIRPE